MSQAAAAAFTIGSAVVQTKQQKALGKYNQQVSERNAQIAEQEANQIGQQAEFDIARFDQKFRQAEGVVEVAVAKSGAVAGSGTAARITEANALEAEMERKITRYNADVGIAKKMQQAEFAKIQGKMARREARIANIQTAAKAGSSLIQIYAPNSIYKKPTGIG
jgi:phenylalanyl-tRNA synthetase alpha subunit